MKIAITGHLKNKNEMVVALHLVIKIREKYEIKILLKKE